MRETAVPDVTGFIYSAGFLLGLHSVFRSGTRYFSLPASLQHSLLSFHAGRKSADISGTYTLQIALWRHARAPVCVSVRVCSCSCNCKRGFRASSARATGCQRVGRDATQRREGWLEASVAQLQQITQIWGPAATLLAFLAHRAQTWKPATAKLVQHFLWGGHSSSFLLLKRGRGNYFSSTGDS